MNPKILIAIPTYENHKYVRAELIKSLRKLTYSCDVLFVTNSGEEDKADLERRKPLLQKPCTVLTYSPESDEALHIIVSGRNIIRDEFLKGNWDYLFMMDDDVILPENAVEMLLENNRDICNGWYINAFEKKGKTVFLPLVYGFKEGYYARQLSLREVLRPQCIHVVMTGMGCCLLKRSVLESVKFPYEEGNATDDTLFFKACNEAGFKVWCDTRVAAKHQKFLPEDPRSKFYDPARYKLNTTKSS